MRAHLGDYEHIDQALPGTDASLSKFRRRPINDHASTVGLLNFAEACSYKIDYSALVKAVENVRNVKYSLMLSKLDESRAAAF
jgi:hypothetical protein